MRRTVERILKCGYFTSELGLFLALATRTMSQLQWTSEDVALSETQPESQYRQKRKESLLAIHFGN